MSADVWIEPKSCAACGRSDEREVELNVTYNLSPMLKAGGFCDWTDLVGMKAKKAGEHIIGVLDHMEETPDFYRAMNPENGWGDYDRCLQGRMRDFAVACLAADDNDRIGGWL